MGNQTKRSRLAMLAGGRATWDQDFAFAMVLPLRTRPLKLALHQSNGRRRGRLLARAYLPLANLFPAGSGEGAPLVMCIEASQQRVNLAPQTSFLPVLDAASADYMLCPR